MDDTESLKNKIRSLETELRSMTVYAGAAKWKKDPAAWEKLNKLGNEISKSWKIDKPSFKIISESRR